MTDKKDEAGKTGSAGQGTPQGGAAGAKPAAADAAKRPHAMIDGKAVEISSTTIRPEPAPAAATPPENKYSSLKAGDAKPAAQGTTPAAAAATAAAKSEGKADAKPESNSSASKGAASPPPASTPRRSSGIGSAFSHLIAGVVGGATAWYGVTALGPELGIVPPPANVMATKSLEDKVASLEKALAARPALPADVTAKLASAEAEIAKLQSAGKSLADINAGQGKLTADVKAMSEALAQQGDAASRLAKLEERLKLLSDAAGDKDSGKLPQLAAVTGRLVDLEQTLTNQLSALRKTVSQELENRLALTNETSEAAKSGTNRVDRELSAVKSETAKLAQKVDTVKAEGDRLAAAVQGIREDGSAVKTALEAVRTDLDTKFKATAKPADVASAIAPVAGKLGALEQNVQTVVKSEEDRKANAERIVLALELNNLKRVIDRGQKYAAELADVKKVAAGKVDLSVLDRYKDSGLPTLADLTRDFRTAANAMLDSEQDPGDGTVLERMLAGAKSVVRVRKVNHAADDKSLEAVIGRMELALKDGRIADVAEQSRALPAKAAALAQDFLVKVESRAAVDKAIATLEASLKSSLAGKATN
jgi:hypothetical protein